MNPLLDVENFPVTLPRETVKLPDNKALVSGVSSFGFSGTNAHVILGEAPTQPEAVRDLVDAGTNGELSTKLRYSRQSFPWFDVRPRLITRRVEVDGVQGFEVPIKDDVYRFVREHVVFGSIVVPGVVYMEMALQALRSLEGQDCFVRNMTMSYPLVIPQQKDGQEPEDFVHL